MRALRVFVRASLAPHLRIILIDSLQSSDDDRETEVQMMSAMVSSNHSHLWDDSGTTPEVKSPEESIQAVSHALGGGRSLQLVVTMRRCPKTGWLDCFLGLAESELHFRHSTVDAAQKVAIHYLVADGRAILNMRCAPEGVPRELWQGVLRKVRSLQARR